MVKAAVRFSRNPLLLMEEKVRYFELKMYQGVNPSSRNAIEERKSELKEIRGRRAYDENFYRRPIGIGVFLALVFFFILGLIYLKI